MADERRAQRLGPEAVAHTNFPTAVRGFDRDEVRAFLQQVAGELRESRDREALLRTELQAAVDRLAERNQLDEGEVTALLGEETARVLTTARQAAADIRAKGEESVARLLREAQDEATRLRSEAETIHQRATAAAEEAAQKIRDEAEAQAAALRAEAESVVAEASAEAERLRAGAQNEAAAMAAQEIERARQEAVRLVQEAQTVRARVLTDLSRKRKAARSQLEQLRAGRDRLLDAYAVVQRTMEEANTELREALPEAKLAAEAAARRIEEEPDDTVEQLEAEVQAAREAGLPLVEPPEATEPVEAVEAAVPVSEVEPPPPPPPPSPAPPPPPVPAPEPEEVVDVPPPPPEPASFRLPKRHRRRRGDPDLGPVEYTPLRAVDPLEEVKIVTGETPAVSSTATVPEPETLSVENEPEVEAEDDVDVDALFAKLRTEREHEVTKAEEVLADPEAESEPRSESGPDDESEAPAETEAEGATEAPPSAPTEEESLLERRDALIEAIENRAARKLKRVLADEQNEVLDQARRTHKTDVDALLGPVAEQEARYAAAAGIYLAEAATEGAAFYGDSDTKPGSVDDLAGELAKAIVGPLRDRLAESARDAGGEEEVLADGIRACYREWKTQRLGTEARHVVFAAFNRGLFAAVPQAACMRWLVDDGGSPCPDAEDNALAGPVRKGEEYPTGHQYPPAHPGCRCLLVPVGAPDA